MKQLHIQALMFLCLWIAISIPVGNTILYIINTYGGV